MKKALRVLDRLAYIVVTLLVGAAILTGAGYVMALACLSLMELLPTAAPVVAWIVAMVMVVVSIPVGWGILVSGLQAIGGWTREQND